MKAKLTPRKLTPQKIYTKWLKALRSGKYKKGKGALANSDDKYCCLGVLCEIAREDLSLKKEIGYDLNYLYEGRSGLLPDKLANFMEMDIGGHSHTDPYLQERSLTFLNDNKNFSFKRIADYIEKNKTKLFKWAAKEVR